MENNDLTYWKNYQVAMQWAKGNMMNFQQEETNEMKDADENEQLEFTINDDLLDFYRHSHDHKANRKNEKYQEKNEAEQFELIPGEQNSMVSHLGGILNRFDNVEVRPNVQSISKLPPVNRSKLRQLELEWLYGSAHSSKIHARETYLQMEFDQMFDKKQPSYFPSLPNRLQLDPQTYQQRSHSTTISILDTTS